MSEQRRPAHRGRHLPGLERRRRRGARARAARRRRACASGTPTRSCRRGPAGVVLPGGFSYGDYLRCGAIARFAPVMDSVRGVRGRRAARCSASATASRSSARPGCCRACCGRTGSCSSSAATSPCGREHAERRSPPRCRSATSSSSRSSTARATGTATPTCRRARGATARSSLRYTEDVERRRRPESRASRTRRATSSA